MLDERRSDIDRRSEKDRRRAYDLDYFFNGGVERRSWMERRSQAERRVGWMRLNKWASWPMRDFKYQQMQGLYFLYLLYCHFSGMAHHTCMPVQYVNGHDYLTIYLFLFSFIASSTLLTLLSNAFSSLRFFSTFLIPRLMTAGSRLKCCATLLTLMTTQLSAYICYSRPTPCPLPIPNKSYCEIENCGYNPTIDPTCGCCSKQGT